MHKLRQYCGACHPCEQDCCCTAVNFGVCVYTALSCDGVAGVVPASCISIRSITATWDTMPACIVALSDALGPGRLITYEVHLSPAATCEEATAFDSAPFGEIAYGVATGTRLVEMVGTTKRVCADAAGLPGPSFNREEMFGSNAACAMRVPAVLLIIRSQNVEIARCVVCTEVCDEPHTCEPPSPPVDSSSPSSPPPSSSSPSSPPPSSPPPSSPPPSSPPPSSPPPSSPPPSSPPPPPPPPPSSSSSPGGTSTPDCCVVSVSGFAGGPCAGGFVTLYGSVSVSCGDCPCSNGGGILTIGGEQFPYMGFFYAGEATVPCLPGGSITISASWSCTSGDCATCPEPQSTFSVSIPV